MIRVGEVVQVPSTLDEEATFELCPSDLVPGMLNSWICWPLFYKDDLDWRCLVNAAKGIERVYPVLCGRLASAENGRHCIRVLPGAEDFFYAVEIHAEMTLLDVRACQRMESGPDPTQPPCMNWPFYFECHGEHSAFRDTETLMGVHLVHLRDGCVLSVAVRHVLCDGERMVALLTDLSRAYRGLDVRSKHLDRSFFWPDSYVQHFSVEGHTPEMYPRQITAPDMPNMEGPKLCIMPVHCSQATIDVMKEKTKDKLEGVDFVSTNDLMCALHWLLKAACKTSPITAESWSLQIDGTALFLSVDVCTTSIPVIPESYFGNATAASLVIGDFEEEHLTTFIDALGQAASLIRQTVNDIQHKPESNLEALLFFYYASNSADEGEGPEMVSIAPSYAKMAVNEIDFGSGGPIYAYTVPPFPLYPLFCAIGNGPHEDGVTLYMVTTEEERQALKTSAVFSECAPTAKIFAKSLSAQDAAYLMGID